MELLDSLDRRLASLERVMIVLLLAGLLGLGLLQVILRNLFASGLFWADELLAHLVLWVGFLGASLATREQRHLSLDLFARVLPARCQAWIACLTNLAALLVCGALSQAAWRFVRGEAATGAVLSFGMATWLAQSVIVVGFMVMALRFALRLLHTLRQLRAPEADR